MLSKSLIVGLFWGLTVKHTFINYLNYFDIKGLIEGGIMHKSFNYSYVLHFPNGTSPWII